MSSHPEPIRLSLPFLKSFFNLFKRYWVSPEKWRAMGLLVLSVILTFAAVRGSVLVNQGNKVFFDALQKFDIPQIGSSFYLFAIGIAVWVGSESIAFYAKEKLCVRWRRWLTTSYLTAWFSKHLHYHLQMEGRVDNPDQRVSEDLASFPALTMGLFFLLLNAVLLFTTYGSILWGREHTLHVTMAGNALFVPGYLFWCALSYGVVSLVVTQKVGRQLANLDFFSERLGANFRFSLVRARENSEQIALLDVGDQEAMRLKSLFAFVYANTRKVINLRTKLNFCSGFFSGTGAIVGAIVALPLFFSKQIQIGSLMQVSGAFSMVFSSFTMLAQSFDVFAQWKSVVFRLIQFNKELDRSEPSSQVVHHKTNEQHIKVCNVALYLPEGQALMPPLNLVFELGTSYLIQGPSGSGKSVFLRTLAGIWPYAQGDIFFPIHHQSVFIPQKPYLPISSLKEILLFNTTREYTDQELRNALRSALLYKYQDSLDTVQHWQHILSLGEQQLLLLAQLLLQKPDLIFLDESTSALDEQAEIYFYQTLRASLPTATIISVGHRASLETLHRHIMTLSCIQKESVMTEHALSLV